MPDNEAYLLAASSRTPWNKGKLIGPNLRYGQNRSGRLARISHTTDGCAACKRIWIAFGAGRGKSVALEGAIFS